MAVVVRFALFDGAGDPLSGLSPVWTTAYDAVAETVIGSPPVITEIGTSGVYRFTRPSEDIAGVIDGVTSLPRYQIVLADLVGTVVAFDVFGVPLASLLLTWNTLVNPVTEVALSQPSFTELAGGLYKFAFPAATEAMGLVDMTGSASPRYATFNRDADMSTMVISGVAIVSDTVVDVTFSEAPLVDAALSDLGNWFVNGITTTDQTIASVVSQSSTVFRITMDEMEDAATYEVDVFNLSDTAGLLMERGPDINQKQFTGQGAPPVSTLISPASPATRSQDIIIELVDVGGGVDLATVLITVEGANAFNAGVFSSPYAGPGSAYTVITGGFRIVIDPETSFVFGQVIDIVVAATDFAGNGIT